MDAIKKFLDKKKKDAKFKLAGEGKKLTASSKPSSHSSSGHKDPEHRATPTSEARKAGAAALARYETKQTQEVNWSLNAIKAQARREIESEKKLAEMQFQESSGATIVECPKEKFLESAPMLAVQGVYFYCPLLDCDFFKSSRSRANSPATGPDVEPYDCIKAKIREFLFSQLGEDKAVASCIIIHTCNKNKEKISLCVETLCKYLENIISNPTEEKFRKIRQSNRAFQDRVACLEGTKEFLEGAGFEEKELPFNERTEMFWVFLDEKLNDLATLESLRDALVSAEPIKPQLDRSLRVLLPKEASTHTDLPPEFFTITLDELKKEMQQRTEAFERSQMLMTKVMREKMELRELRKYRFTLMRIRFPDGIILQGTFAVNEKFSNVLSFIRENLVNDWRPFFLTLSGGGKIAEEDRTLLDLHLAPAILFNFQWDSSVQDPNLDDRVYLKEEIMLLLQSGE